jgi:hypothetical protein
MLAPAMRFQPHPDVVTRDIPDGAMLVNVQTGSAFKLNWVGAQVWRQLDGQRAIGEIVTGLERQYAVAAEQLGRDVDALLEDLQKQGLVSRVENR